MKYLPFEDIVYKTKLNCDEVVRQLSTVIVPERTLFQIFKTFDDDTYHGQVNTDSFKIYPAINGRNSFLPIIIGEIQPTSFGSQIHIKMRMHFVVIVFMIVWCSIPILGSIESFIKSFNSGRFNPAVFIPFICFPLIGYLVTMYAFKSKSIHCKNHLQNLFDAEIIKE